MPQLPTFDVTQAQANRLLKAFGSVEAYQVWLREQLVQYVIQSESRAIDEEASVKKQKMRQDLIIELTQSQTTTT